MLDLETHVCVQFAELQSSPAPPPPTLHSLQAAGSDSMANSLEDLVSTFDEKLTMCFGDYKEQVTVMVTVLFNDITLSHR